VTGRCLCGAVRFEITGKLGPVAYCHCETCRRANGTAFAANAPVRTRYLAWAGGREAISEYESSPGKLRAFCSRCGSPVYSRRVDEPDLYRIRLGTLDEDPGRRAFGHFWVSEKAPWFDVADGLPQYREGTMTEDL
jgi:hypothetical protein